MVEIHNAPIVLDNGSGTIRAGFAGEDLPKCTFPSFVGRPKHLRVLAGALEGDVFIGSRAQELRGLLKIRYPLEHGIVTDWDDMERIWQWVYQEELKTMSEEVRLCVFRPCQIESCQCCGAESSAVWLTLSIASGSSHRAASESSYESRYSSPDSFRDLQCPSPVSQHTGRSLPLRFRSDYRYSPRCGRWCVPCRSCLRRICYAFVDTAYRYCRTRCHRTFTAFATEERLCFPY